MSPEGTVRAEQPPKRRLLDQVRDRRRVRHLALKTEGVRSEEYQVRGPLPGLDAAGCTPPTVCWQVGNLPHGAAWHTLALDKRPPIGYGVGNWQGT